MRLYWVPAIGDRDMRRVTLGDVQEVVAAMRAKLDPSTIATYVAILRSLFSSAADNGFIDDARVLRRLVLPRVDAKPVPHWTLEQTQHFLRWVREHEPYWYAPLLMAVRLGPRRQELIELEWKHIDLSESTVEFYAPKTGRSRVVPMSAALAEAVAAHPRHVHGRHFLTTHRGRRPEPYKHGGSLYNAFQQLLVRSNSPRISFHTLRHTAVSHLDAKGATTRGLQQMLGHSCIKTTERYVHPKTDALRVVMQAVDEANG
jgi:integrase/recombinase XerC